MNIRYAACAALGATLAIGAATPVAAAEYWLQVRETPKVVAMPGGGADSVTMWEYAECGVSFAEPCAATAPGPLLRVPAGDTQLIIHVQNSLARSGAGIELPHVAAYGGSAVPTSIMVPGLPSPGFASGATAGSCPSGAAAPVEAGGRIRSFTAEVPNGGTGTYCWSVHPGTFLYQSGTHPAIQVQMGLYGALVVEAAAASCAGAHCAYAGVGYDREVLAVFSEIDPRVHAKVGDGSYGDPAAADPMTSTVFYEPQYFFIDGAADGAPLTSLGSASIGAPGQRVLLRLVNAGIENHAPLLQGGHFTIVAEDSNVLSAAFSSHSQHATLLAAAKTLDAVLTVAAPGTYPLLDRRRMTANAAPATVVSGVPAAASGMLVNLVASP